MPAQGRRRSAGAEFSAALAAFALVFSCVVRAETAVCHVDYGGETRRFEAPPTSDPYRVPTVAVGSYFLFRLVFEARTAIKIYVYADRDGDVPLPLHQGVYPWPATMAPRHGFTGQQRVYEPLRDGELAYWCEMRP